MTPSRWVPVAAVAAAGALAGMLAGWALWHPKETPRETYAPEIRQKDGSLVLERKPMAEADARAAVRVPEIPKGGQLERAVSVTVQPRALEPIPTPSPTDAPGTPTPGAAPCPPVRVDLALVRMPDRSRRVEAWSPDGTVVAGLDVPVDAPEPQPRPLKWTASLIRTWEPSTGRQRWGGMIQREMGPFAVGVGGFQGGAFASVGVRF